MPLQKILVLGAGSAGLMTALTLKRRIPQLDVAVVRSPELGVIGVGEGTTVGFPRHFFEYLKLKPRQLKRQKMLELQQLPKLYPQRQETR